MIIGGRSKRTEVCPNELCREIRIGLKDQTYEDGRLQAGSLGSLCPIDDDGTSYKEYKNCEVWDDLSGTPLKKEGVIKVRIDEISQLQNHSVYSKKPLQESYEVTGKGPIGVRWIDINKGDETDEEYRSKLVAQEVNNTNIYIYIYLQQCLHLKLREYYSR